MMHHARIAVALALVGCGGAHAGAPATPEYHPEGQTKAHAAKSALRPLVVEWPATDRAALESRRASGVVVVRYAQGEMELLPGCRSAAHYQFARVTPKEEGLVVRTRDELHAAMPIHSATLEGRLAKHERLDVKLTVVGLFATEPRAWHARDLTGDCARATHVVTELSVGAFEIVASASEGASAGVRVMGASAGASHEGAREVVNRDGRAEACTGEGAPPAGCGALLRVELAPLAVPVQTGACAPGDVACMTARAQGGCSPGFVRKGDVCEAANPERPSLVQGLGGR